MNSSNKRAKAGLDIGDKEDEPVPRLRRLRAGNGPEAIIVRASLQRDSIKRRQSTEPFSDASRPHHQVLGAEEFAGAGVVGASEDEAGGRAV